jgi:hypothetical protein
MGKSNKGADRKSGYPRPKALLLLISLHLPDGFHCAKQKK